MKKVRSKKENTIRARSFIHSLKKKKKNKLTTILGTSYAHEPTIFIGREGS